MKKYNLTLFFVLLGILSIGSAFAQKRNIKNMAAKTSGLELRSHLNFNRDWRFSLGDSVNAQGPSYDDQTWSRVGLPHSFSMPYFMWKSVYNGYGWYRKQFEVPASWSGKTVSIEFEGSFIETEVYINGQLARKHVGGYTGFTFDITKLVHAGSNIIAVRVNNLWSARVAPRAGDHQFSGGIYRDVYLNVTDNLHVDWCGTYITTPVVSKTSATCKAQTEVRNDYSEDKTCTVKTEIAGPDGSILSTIETTDIVPKNQVKIFTQILPDIANPKLWSPASPALHKAITTISYNGTAVDTYETTFGIRWFTWSATQGFFLNGEHYYLLGANVHQDHAGWGDAVANSGFRRDVQMMKDAGFNCLRGSHYPHDPAYTEACDKIGIIYFSENAFWGMGGGSGDRNSWGTPSSSCYPPNAADQPFFDQSLKAQLKEMIKIHRNRASIIAWSMCNEPFFTDASTTTPMKALLNAATDSTRKWDPSRLVAIGGAQRAGVDKLGKNAIAFYNGDGASFTNPGVPNMVSEYSSRSAQRPGDFSPAWGELSPDGFIHPVWRGGQVIWCGFDHGTVGGEGLATMGLVDYFRLPKRQYYWYQEAYAKGNTSPVEPTWPTTGKAAKLKLSSSQVVIAAPDGTDDVQLVISVYDTSGKQITNNVPVKLAIVSGPGEFPTGTSINFVAPSGDEASDIYMREGQAAIEFRSYYAGTTKIEATSPGLAKDTITITTQGTPVWVEGVTPKVEDRPYRRYAENQQPLSVTELLLAKNRPSSVSSTLAGTSKVNVNDDDATTFWKPETTDTERWWKLDLEAAYCLNRIQIEFPTAAAYRYIIEVSADDVNWTKVIDQSQSTNNTKVRMAYGNLGRNVRFVRIKFTTTVAGLAEVKIGGAPNLPEKPGLLTGTIIGTAGSWGNDANTTKEAAMDFDATTFFDGPSGGSPFWVGLDLGYGSEYTVNKINFTPRDGMESRMQNSVFESSSVPAFTTKFPIYTVSVAPQAGVNAVTVSNNQYSRYVRYLSTDAGNGNIAELEMYGVAKTTALDKTSYNSTQSKVVIQKKKMIITFNSIVSELKSVNIYDVNGMLVKKDNVDDNTMEISLDNMKTGTYLVCIIYGANKAETYKFVL